MLAIFDKTVAKVPEELKSPQSESDRAESKDSLLNTFSTLFSGAVTVNLGPLASISYSSHKLNPLLPRLFAVVDDMFCLFEGHIENLTVLKQLYGLSKSVNEATIVIEAYRTLRDRGPYPADQVVRDINGKFAFILFDCSTRATFIAADADGNVTFFWGINSEGNLVLSDDADIMKKGCGKSFAPFPKGCFYTSSKGLQSFEHPMNEVKPMSRVDSQGQVCGAEFKVDAETKKVSGMPRVGSAANWSSQY